MAKKKASTHKPAAPQKPAKNNLLIIGIIAVAVIAGGVWFATKGSTSSPAGVGTASAATAPPEEQKYIGRLLPAGYTEPSLAAAQTYSGTIKMTTVTGGMTKTDMTIPVSELVADKIVYFEHQRTDGQTLPLIAYIKPSGKLFVGVSFCLPCKGTKQRIEGGQLVCEACGTTRDLETGVGLSGSCKLYPLDEVPATVSGGTITIANSVLDSWTPQPQDRQVGGQ
jgi:hypothetical protein